MAKYEGAEFRLPPFEDILEPAFRIPFISYFLLFQIIAYCIRTYAWKSYSGFKQYRLRNLTLCVMHSSISGLWSFVFSVTHRQVMLEETIHWYSPWAAQLPILSMGLTVFLSLHHSDRNGRQPATSAYFICDTMDMLRHEISKWTIELLFHHAITVFVFASAVFPRKFIPYAYWALLMEVNSIFLHLRSLMQITGYSLLKQSLFRLIRFTNIVTFVLFRFAVQIWQINWAWINRHRFHIFYLGIAVIGGAFFFIINVVLFVRILASDGYLGEFGRQHTAIDRDSQKSIRIVEHTKNS
uniref:TLC domain-containing protein n=1 Tax=Setaria digitata TaxID=48799 RepID=A0A915PPH2_9BILA